MSGPITSSKISTSPTWSFSARTVPGGPSLVTVEEPDVVEAAALVLATDAGGIEAPDEDELVEEPTAAPAVEVGGVPKADGPDCAVCDPLG